MAHHKRSPVQRERDYQTIAELYLQGCTQLEIADRLELSQSQISLDLKVIKKRWQASSMANFDLLMQIQMARIDLISRTLWEGYERSLSPREIVTQQVFCRGSIDDSRSGDVCRTTKNETVESHPIAYMNALIKVEYLRCKVLGLATSPGSVDEIAMIEGMIRLGLLPDSILDLAVEKAADFTKTMREAIAGSSQASFSSRPVESAPAHSRQGV
jgi:hypothetical protein